MKLHKPRHHHQRTGSSSAIKRLESSHGLVNSFRQGFEVGKRKDEVDRNSRSNTGPLKSASVNLPTSIHPLRDIPPLKVEDDNLIPNMKLPKTRQSFPSHDSSQTRRQLCSCTDLTDRVGGSLPNSSPLHPSPPTSPRRLRREFTVVGPEGVEREPPIRRTRNDENGFMETIPEFCELNTSNLVPALRRPFEYPRLPPEDTLYQLPCSPIRPASGVYGIVVNASETALQRPISLPPRPNTNEEFVQKLAVNRPPSPSPTRSEFSSTTGLSSPASVPSIIFDDMPDLLLEDGLYLQRCNSEESLIDPFLFRKLPNPKKVEPPPEQANLLSVQVSDLSRNSSTTSNASSLGLNSNPFPLPPRSLPIQNHAFVGMRRRAMSGNF